MSKSKHMKQKSTPKRCFLWMLKALNTNVERNTAGETKPTRCRAPGVKRSRSGHRSPSACCQSGQNHKPHNVPGAGVHNVFSTDRAPDHRVLPRAVSNDSAWPNHKMHHSQRDPRAEILSPIFKSSLYSYAQRSLNTLMLFIHQR